MRQILKVILAFALIEINVFQSEASPSNLGVQKFNVIKPTFIYTAQFVDRCAATKLCIRSNKQCQIQRAQIGLTSMPSLKVKSMLPATRKNNRQTNRGIEIIDAVKKNDLKSVTKLIAKQVDIDERDNSEMTALHWAAEKGHVDAAKMLIENRAEIDARDKYFNTPLHVACSHDFSQMIELLIDSGADIYAYNLMNVYPLKLCTISIENFRPRLLKAAERAGKLYDAVESGDLKLVQKLVGEGLNINFENPCGETALTVAISKGNKNIAEWLVKNGADVNIQSCDGTTPLDLAKNTGMSLPPCKMPDWKSVIASARKTVNKWLFDNPSQEEIRAETKGKHHYLSWIAYHPLMDIYNFLNYLQAMNSNICKLHNIGDWTSKGKFIQLLEISNGNPNNKAVWIDGAIHGNEFISTSSVTYIANELMKNWNTSHIQNIDWYILAVYNPDGYEYAFQFDRLWQKNRAKSGPGGPSGIDLNRNYDFKWGVNDSVHSPNDDTYGGQYAFSERETSTVKKLILKTLKGRLNAFISFQSYGQYIMYAGDNDKDVERVGREAAKHMKTVDNQTYKVGTSQSMFNTTAVGSGSEWAKSIGIKYSYTVNLRDTGRYGYFLPPSFIEITAKEAQAFVWTVSKSLLDESK